MPIIVQNLVNNSLAMVDTFMVGTLGEASLSGVTLANTVFFILNLINFGLQSGSMVLISQYWGKRDTSAINRILGISFGIAGSISLIAAVIIILFPVQIYSLTSNDPQLVQIAAEYARIAAMGYFLNSMSMIYMAAVRAMGDAKPGMRVLIVSMAVNTFLNWVMIYGNLGFPAMGVAGAALATSISRIAEASLTVIYALRSERFRLNIKLILRPGLIIAKDFARYSAPVVINEGIWSFGFSLYAVIIGHLPNAVTAVAAYTIALTIERLLSGVYFGIGGAAAVLVGTPLGAGDKEKAHAAGVTMLALTFGFGLCLGLIMLLLTDVLIAPYIFPLFATTEETLQIGKFMLRVLAVSMPFKAFNFCVIVGVLRGGGDVKAGVALDISTMYLVALPFSAIAGLVLGAPIYIVYILISSEELVKSFLSYWRFSQKKWLRDVTRQVV
ncbi:MAG: MATE family efflux transporter [Clostridiales bacterium]|nr:MATE family efflux transporter [Clostridiales bacterium]